MSRTLKDGRARRTGNSVLEIVKREDGALDLFMNKEVLQLNVQRSWLAEWLCVRFGFCGEEYSSAVGELDCTGHLTLTF